MLQPVDPLPYLSEIAMSQLQRAHLVAMSTGLELAVGDSQEFSTWDRHGSITDSHAG